MGITYHVKKDGTGNFCTINEAAQVALPGDRIVVHEGTYRECVDPKNSGKEHNLSIIYEAAEDEHVTIKGSEIVKNWEELDGSVWKANIPNELFGDFNPFDIPLTGDWLVEPYNHPVHLGDVYINGKSMFEARTLEELENPVKRMVSPYPTWRQREEKIADPDWTIYQWFAEKNDIFTTIYANFHDLNPQNETIEISVRQNCFYPKRTGINYITVRGFEMCMAATPWAPPTADQPGLIGPHWSKGWVIENNIIHDSKCCGISLGKEESTGNNAYTKWNIKSGYQTQMEAVFKASAIGWSKETIGSHLVRNNRIYNCGQCGIVGHMGGIFSTIEDNEIYNISVKHEFYGHELGGIKMHAAIDTIIRHNYIHHCSLGTWLDWEAQGTRISQNIYTENNRDLMIEVTHGPCLVDNNIFSDSFSIVNAAQGTAFVHNIVGGFIEHYKTLDRSTPYHFPHSTKLMGTTLVYGNDDRWYQNIFFGGPETDKNYGTADYNGSPVSLEEFIQRVKSRGHGDVHLFAKENQPAYINGNLYLNGAKSFDKEKEKIISDKQCKIKIDDRKSTVSIEISLPEELLRLHTNIITTETLSETRLTEEFFENRDGTPLYIDHDLNGKTRSKAPMCGALENVSAGNNKVKIWSRK